MKQTLKNARFQNNYQICQQKNSLIYKNYLQTTNYDKLGEE
jgi:hypothetical protein